MTANDMRHRFILKMDGALMMNKTFNDREISDWLTKGEKALIKERYDALKNRTQRGYPQGIRGDELAGIITGTEYIGKDKMIVGSEDNGALLKPDIGMTDYTDGTAFSSDDFGYFVPIPDEAMYILREHVHTTNGTKHLRNVSVREVGMDEYSALIFNGYRKPYKNLVWSIDWGSFTVASYSDGSFTDSSKSNSVTGTGTNMDGSNSSDETVNINTFRAKYLIPGRDWNVEGYRVFYIKEPSEIIVDVQDPSAQQHCELAPFLHDEVVEMAVKEATSALIQEQGKYQAAVNETKENQ